MSHQARISRWRQAAQPPSPKLSPHRGPLQRAEAQSRSVSYVLRAGAQGELLLWCSGSQVRLARHKWPRFGQLLLTTCTIAARQRWEDGDSRTSGTIRPGSFLFLQAPRTKPTTLPIFLQDHDPTSQYVVDEWMAGVSPSSLLVAVHGRWRTESPTGKTEAPTGKLNHQECQWSIRCSLSYRLGAPSILSPLLQNLVQMGISFSTTIHGIRIIRLLPVTSRINIVNSLNSFDF